MDSITAFYILHLYISCDIDHSVWPHVFYTPVVHVPSHQVTHCVMIQLWYSCWSAGKLHIVCEKRMYLYVLWQVSYVQHDLSCSITLCWSPGQCLDTPLSTLHIAASLLVQAVLWWGWCRSLIHSVISWWSGHSNCVWHHYIPTFWPYHITHISVYPQLQSGLYSPSLDRISWQTTGPTAPFLPFVKYAYNGHLLSHINLYLLSLYDELTIEVCRFQPQGKGITFI